MGDAGEEAVEELTPDVKIHSGILPLTAQKGSRRILLLGGGDAPPGGREDGLFVVAPSNKWVKSWTTGVVAGAHCEENTFDGERCLYGALNDKIKKMLKSYKAITSSTIRRDCYYEFLRRCVHLQS